MKKKVCIVTSTRAEYGLLQPLIQKMTEDDFFDVRIAVTGTHLKEDYGMTYRAIEADGYKIDEMIDILPEADKEATAAAMAAAIEKFAGYFRRESPDLLVLLGDRYEIFAIAAAAVVQQIPIAHIHGGEISEGAYDDSFRHCITKMSQIHFPSCTAYAKRIIQMGEQPDTVFPVGAMGVENIKRLKLLDREQLAEAIDFDLKMPYAVMTFHPVTLEQRDSLKDVEEILKAIDFVDDMKFIFTKANADDGGTQINERLQEYSIQNPDKVKLFDNLGQIRYLSAVKHCTFVLGNSSSGMIEVPALNKPTVNVGNRQKGRIKIDSIINCEPSCDDILTTMQKARSAEMRELCQTLVSPFDGGETSGKIKKEIKRYLKGVNGNIQKRFYDIDFSIKS